MNEITEIITKRMNKQVERVGKMDSSTSVSELADARTRIDELTGILKEILSLAPYDAH